MRAPEIVIGPLFKEHTAENNYASASPLILRHFVKVSYGSIAAKRLKFRRKPQIVVRVKMIRAEIRLRGAISSHVHAVGPNDDPE